MKNVKKLLTTVLLVATLLGGVQTTASAISPKVDGGPQYVVVCGNCIQGSTRVYYGSWTVKSSVKTTSCQHSYPDVIYRKGYDLKITEERYVYERCDVCGITSRERFETRSYSECHGYN
jgi:hypothetical protein